MKTLVAYRSKSGYTRNYAEWIASELGADLLDSAAVTADRLKTYDAVVFVGGIYASGINGFKDFQKKDPALHDKLLAVFAVGVSPGRPEELEGLLNHNMTPAQRERTRFFYLRGGFEYSRLGFVDRILMQVLKWTLKRKKQLTPDERGMLNVYDHPVDFSRPESIRSLVEYVRSEAQKRGLV